MNTKKVYVVSFGFDDGLFKNYNYYDLDQLKQDIIIGDLYFDFLRCKTLYISQCFEVLDDE